MSSRKGSIFIAAALLAASLPAIPAMADPIPTTTIFTFQGDSDRSATYPELDYTIDAGLTPDVGAIGNGDASSSPGLFGIISGGLTGIAQSPPRVGPGPFSNMLADLTLVLTGFTPVGDAVQSPGSINQDLHSGTFALVYPGLSKPILAGTVQNALVTELKSTAHPATGDSASVLSGTVTYTDSLLEDQFVAAGLTHTGSLSFSLSGLTGSYGTTTVGTHHYLSNFSGDLIGTFDVTPVPSPAAVWGGFGLIGLLGAARLKKRRTMSA